MTSSRCHTNTADWLTGIKRNIKPSFPSLIEMTRYTYKKPLVRSSLPMIKLRLIFLRAIHIWCPQFFWIFDPLPLCPKFMYWKSAKFGDFFTSPLSPQYGRHIPCHDILLLLRCGRADATSFLCSPHVRYSDGNDIQVMRFFHAPSDVECVISAYVSALQYRRNRFCRNLLSHKISKKKPCRKSVIT